MEYKDIRENLEEMMNDNYKDFIKALVSIEKGVTDEKSTWRSLCFIYEQWHNRSTKRWFWLYDWWYEITR